MPSKIDAAARARVALRASDPTEDCVMSDTSKRATLESILPKLQKHLFAKEADILVDLALSSAEFFCSPDGNRLPMSSWMNTATLGR